MSTDRPQPPSIAPKTPPGGPGANLRTASDTGLRPARAPFSPPPIPPTTAPGGAPTPTPPASPVTGPGATAFGPSVPVADRMQRPVQGHPARTTGRDLDDESRAAKRPAPASTTSTSSSPVTAGPRRVRLAVARIDPWSVMKLAFLLSVAVGIMIVVAAAVVWYTLDNLAVFTRINEVVATLAGSTDFFDITEYASFERVISLATMIGVVDIVLLTALSTLGAFLYNIVAALVGGIHLTLTDD